MIALNYCWRPLTADCEAWGLDLIEVTAQPDKSRANGIISLAGAHPAWNYKGIYWRPAPIRVSPPSSDPLS